MKITTKEQAERCVSFRERAYTIMASNLIAIRGWGSEKTVTYNDHDQCIVL